MDGRLALRVLLLSSLALLAGQVSHAEKEAPQRVSSSRWGAKGERPDGTKLRLQLDPGLLERALVDHELRGASSAETETLRRHLLANRLLFSWSLRQQEEGGALVWRRVGQSAAPTITGTPVWSSGKTRVYEMKVVEGKVSTVDELVYRVRLRLGLGAHDYDVLLLLNVEILPQKGAALPALRYGGSWYGPFPPGEGEFPTPPQQKSAR